MRQRAAIILIENGRLALIKRVQEGNTYYVFPGGGVETGESLSEAAKREALEELGLIVEIGDCLFETTGIGREFYFQAHKTGGHFGQGTGAEFSGAGSGRGSYEAVWVPLEQVQSITLYPEKLASRILQEHERQELSGE
ncbi:NUDIX hydrolase [Planococcus sp. CAU13]|uniref:NUDIX hydrolase n=1 Tax=Planococcus sp. CAU13 TaxID=1541197 RepID=UPI00052FEB60|nr:NUDIX domain-containing protein [Planococcus sp. CAU13]